MDAETREELQALLGLAAEIWIDGGGDLIGWLAESERAFGVLRGEPAHTRPDAFDRFWQVYPRHVAMKQARAAFEAALKRATAEVIVEGARRYRNDPNRDPAFTAHPTTWLNGDRWGDDPLPPREGDRRPRPPQERTGEAARAIAARHDEERRGGEPSRVDPKAMENLFSGGRQALQDAARQRRQTP